MDYLLISLIIIPFLLQLINISLNKPKRYIRQIAFKKNKVIFLRNSFLVFLVLYLLLFIILPLLLCSFNYVKITFKDWFSKNIIDQSLLYFEFINQKSSLFIVLFNAILAMTILVFWLQQRSLKKQLHTSILFTFNETNRLLWQSAMRDTELGKCFLTQDDWASEDKEIYFLSQRIEWFEYVFRLFDHGIIGKDEWEYWEHYFKKLLLTEPKFRELMLSVDPNDYYTNYFKFAQKVITENDIESIKPGDKLKPNPKWEETINKECLSFSLMLNDCANKKGIGEVNAVEFGKSIWRKARVKIDEKISE